MVVALGLVLPRAVALAGDHGDYPIAVVIGAEEIHHRLGLAGRDGQGGVYLPEEGGGGFLSRGFQDKAVAQVAAEEVYTAAAGLLKGGGVTPATRG